MGTLNVTSTSNGIMEQLRSALSDQFSAIAPFEIVLGLVLGLLVGLLIAFVYKRCFRGVLYSPSFAMTLAMLTLITTPVVMCISSNVALSMGMVGALSIVRFRTAVKDPMDTAYMFWALTMGILLGAKLYAIALVVAAAIAAIIFLLTLVHFTTPNSYLLVVHYDARNVIDQTCLFSCHTIKYTGNAHAFCRKATDNSNQNPHSAFSIDQSLHTMPARDTALGRK